VTVVATPDGLRVNPGVGAPRTVATIAAAAELLGSPKVPA
jgi:hypothetical protein